MTIMEAGTAKGSRAVVVRRGEGQTLNWGPTG
jgi:hypothetical protein